MTDSPPVVSSPDPLRSTAPAPAGQDAAPGRDHAIDALRGFALLGILIVNAGSFASAYYSLGVPEPAFSRPLDDVVRWLVAFVFETKFYLLFSLLFGYSFALQMASAERTGAAFGPRFLRRLLGLSVLGVAHAWLLYAGDILVTYAVLGLLLLALRKIRPGTAVVLAVALLALVSAGWGLAAWGLAQAPMPPVPLAELHAKAQLAADAYRASAADAIAQRGRDMAEGVWFVLVWVQGPCALAMFLLGLAAQRSGYLAALALQPDRLQRWMRVCLPIGLAGAWVYAWGQSSGVRHTDHLAIASLAVDLATSPFLSLGYAAALLWVLRRGPRGRRLGEALAPAGRMALSNYLLQSVAGAMVFTAYGLALMGQVSPLGVLLGCVALYAAQLAFSRCWMARHAYGPVEWGLRAFTLLRRPAWRRSGPQGD
ncbi:DUF418 domain-containing protein [Acidovorax sp. sic0104]|uniref:DUF418 domain-containing protein n=1 Tax=Acidovorax sp. sic0104 TaxID=2854784 RepID=UPI001C439FF5|nr:DUF418 domain-containing protein [Acidovorax sp. sic0104]MBV7541698.1 DUF418 domain-containing protein [Acidovorax sp. sic0104]